MYSNEIERLFENLAWGMCFKPTKRLYNWVPHHCCDSMNLAEKPPSIERGGVLVVEFA